MSIQGLLEEALQPIEGAPVNVHGAGRTDAGVHALGQVCQLHAHRHDRSVERSRARSMRCCRWTCASPARRRCRRFPCALQRNRQDLRVPHRQRADSPPPSCAVTSGTSCRRSISRRCARRPRLLSARTTSRRSRGRADVRARTDRAHDSVGSNGAAMCGADDPLVMEVEGDGFLRHMVRNIAGTLVEIGLGRYASRQRSTRILASRDRAHAGPTAPPQGLFLSA